MEDVSASLADMAQNDPLSRTPHDYAVDSFVERKLEETEDQDVIVLKEKDYFYTSRNTYIEDIKEVGSPRDIYGNHKGDLDVAVIYLRPDEKDLLEMEHFELTEEENIGTKAYQPEEQVGRISDSIDLINRCNGTSIVYSGEPVIIEEETERTLNGHPESYSEGYTASDEVLEHARGSEIFEVLDEDMFDEKFFHGIRF